MLVAEHISAVLLVTGTVTALPLLQFFFPVTALKYLHKLSVEEPSGRFFARHWGLIAFSVAVLLIYAAHHPEVRVPVMLAALIEKLGLVIMVAAHWNRSYARGLRGAAIFDAACVVIYGLYLSGLA